MQMAGDRHEQAAAPVYSAQNTRVERHVETPEDLQKDERAAQPIGHADKTTMKKPVGGKRDALLRRTLEGHASGLAFVAADGTILERIGEASSWLPAEGRSCFEAPMLVGMEDEFLQLRQSQSQSTAQSQSPNIVMPGVGTSALGKLTASIAWSEDDQCFTLFTMRTLGANNAEVSALRERRERQLAQEQAEAARKRADISDALYRDIVERNGDMVLRLSSDRRILFANQAARQFLGRQADGLIGANIADALAPCEGSAWSTIGPLNDLFEQKLMGANGQSAWVWWRASWLGDNSSEDGISHGPSEYQLVGRDITALRQLRADIDRANVEARLALVMRERLKIAHDLHDTIVHSLVAVVAQLRLVRKLVDRMTEKLPAKIHEELALAETAAQEGLTRSREALGQVRFERAGVDGLAAALFRATQRFAERSGIKIDTEIDEALAGQSGERAEILYRIVEEALRNVEAHSGAQNVALSAQVINRVIHVTVQDDGKGFDASLDHPGHYGLIGMGEQARMIGGAMTVTSRPGAGVRTLITAPLFGLE